MISFSIFQHTYNKICICYFGNDALIIKQLFKIIKELEKKHQDIVFSVCLRDDLETEEKNIKKTNFKKNDFGYTYVLEGSPTDNLVNILRKDFDIFNK